MNEETKARLLDELRGLEPVYFEQAQRIALRENLDIRSVTALAVKNGIRYIKKERLNKTGRPVVNKQFLLESIFSKLGEPMPSLAKLNKEELQRLLEALV